MERLGTGSDEPTAEELAALETALTAVLPGEGQLGLAPVRQSAGNSHSVYQITRGDLRWALRVAPNTEQSAVGGAYNLSREARILHAIQNSDIPHASVVTSRAELGLEGRDFIVLQWVDGVPLAGDLPPPCRTAEDCARLTADIVRVLATISAFDWETARLVDRHHNTSFFDAQIGKCAAMRHAFRTRLTPVIDELSRSLAGLEPASARRRALMHGDFCSLNMLCAPNSPRLEAVVDWETATIGDPLLDLGYLTARWVRPDRSPMLAELSLGGDVPSAHALLPHWTALLEQYARHVSVELDALPAYQGLAMLRLATAVEGRVAASRARAREPEALHFARLADAVAARGLQLLRGEDD